MKKVIDFIMLILSNFGYTAVLLRFTYGAYQHYLNDDVRFYVFVGLLPLMYVYQVYLIWYVIKKGPYFYRESNMYKYLFKSTNS